MKDFEKRNAVMLHHVLARTPSFMLSRTSSRPIRRYLFNPAWPISTEKQRPNSILHSVTYFAFRNHYSTSDFRLIYCSLAPEKPIRSRN